MLSCAICLENGETIEAEKGNQLINEIVSSLKGRGYTAMYLEYILDEVKKEISQHARF